MNDEADGKSQYIRNTKKTSHAQQSCNAVWASYWWDVPQCLGCRALQPKRTSIFFPHFLSCFHTCMSTRCFSRRLMLLTDMMLIPKTCAEQPVPCKQCHLGNRAAKPRYTRECDTYIQPRLWAPSVAQEYISKQPVEHPTKSASASSTCSLVK